jgi:hypothetical protein
VLDAGVRASRHDHELPGLARPLGELL